MLHKDLFLDRSIRYVILYKFHCAYIPNIFGNIPLLLLCLLEDNNHQLLDKAVVNGTQLTRSKIKEKIIVPNSEK